ncbi:MAG TPA: PQQ-binding-like beta-propeller repeat protein [Methylomirabilota bacterium]|nr:PQQ-binding-like beta-propeller repeat protein [Methylomirabilota bacterium]
MKRVVIFLTAPAVLLASEANFAQAQTATSPVIASLSATTLSRSGRLLIQGSGFGAAQGDGQVVVGGLTAPITRWSDSSIAAYVPETTALGSVFVQVLAGGRASNAMPLTVTLRQSDGRIKWRFQADSMYVYQRPAVGLDGTIVVHDSSGLVYSLQPDGGLKWIFKTPAFAYGPPSIGSDGSVYVASINTIYALNPDGTLKWQFNDPNSQGVMAGPTVGPDGRIYAVMDLNGLGALALSPDGQLLWSNPGNPVMFEYGNLGAEVVFGPSRAGGAVDQLYLAFDRQGDSHLWAFRLDGSPRWVIQTGTANDLFMQRQAQPAVEPDGTIYLTSLVSTIGWGLQAFEPGGGGLRWSFFPYPANGMSASDVGPDSTIYLARSLDYLQAVDPNGSARWQVFDDTIVDYPVVSPANNLLFAGGRPDFGQPGFVRGYSLSGQPIWTVNLGTEAGGNQIMYSRPRFTLDGQTIYFGTTILGGSQTDPYSYLYALDSSGSSTVTVTTAPPVPLATTDSVAIQQAEYRRSRQRLTVSSTSSSASATLKAYVAATGELIGTLTNNGGGMYSGQFRRSVNPQNVTVRSSLGGSATKAVSVK